MKLMAFSIEAERVNITPDFMDGSGVSDKRSAMLRVMPDADDPQPGEDDALVLPNCRGFVTHVHEDGSLRVLAVGDPRPFIREQSATQPEGSVRIGPEFV